MKTAGLGGLAQKVKQGIVNIKSKVDAFLNKMLERVKPWINKVLGKDGEKKVKQLEDGWEWFVGFRDKGLAFLGEKLGELLHNWESKFIGIAVDYVRNELIARAVVEVTKMMVPIAGWIAGLQKLIQTIKFVVQILTDVFGAIGEALKGNPQKAIDLVEGALSNQVPRAIDWLAGLIGFKDLGAKIRKALEGLRNWVEDGIKKLVDWVVNAPGVRQILKVVGVEETDKEDHDEWVIKGKELLEADIAAYSGELDLDAGKAIAAKANSSKVKGWREEMRTYGIYKSLKAVSIADAKTAWSGAGAIEQGKRYNKGAGEALEEAEFAFVGEASRMILPYKILAKPGQGAGKPINKVAAAAGTKTPLHVYKSAKKAESNIAVPNVPIGTILWVHSELPGGWYKVGARVTTFTETGSGSLNGGGFWMDFKAKTSSGFGFVDKTLMKVPPLPIDQDMDLTMPLSQKGETPVKLVADAYNFKPASGFWPLYNRNDNDTIHQYVRMLSFLNPTVFTGGDKWWETGLRAGMYYWLPSKEAAAKVVKEYNIPKTDLADDAVTVAGDIIKKKVLEELKKQPNGEQIFAKLEKIAGQAKDIWDHFDVFVDNLAQAAQGGLNRFIDNFNLGDFAAKVVTNSPEAKLPRNFDMATADFMGWANAALSLLGLDTPESVANRLVSYLPAQQQKQAGVVEKALVYVKKVWTNDNGFVGAFQDEVESFKSNFDELKTSLLKDLKTWVMGQVGKAIGKILTFFVPGLGPIITMIQKVWDMMNYLIDQARRLADLVNTIWDNVVLIARGDLKAAEMAIEKTLNRLSLTVVQSLIGLAGTLLGNSGLVQEFQQKFKNLKIRVEGYISKLFNKVLGRKDVANAVGVKPTDETPAPSSDLTKEQKQTIINTAKGEADALVTQSDDALDLDLVQGVANIKTKHKLTKASVEEDSEKFWVHLELNPTGDSKKKKSQLKLAIGEAVVEMQKPGVTAAEVEAALPGIAKTYKLQSLELESKSGGQYQVKGQLKDSSSGKMITRSSVAMKLGTGSIARVTDAEIEKTVWHTAAKTKAKNLLKADTALSLKTLLDLHTKIKTTDLFLKPLNVDIGAFSTDMRNNIAEPATKNAVVALKAAWKTAGKNLEPTQEQVLDRPEDAIITSAVRGTFNSEPAKKPFLKAKDLFRTILFDNQAPPRTAASSGFEPEMQEYLEGALEEAKPHQEYKIVESSVQDQSDPNQPNTSTISFDTVTGAKYTVTWIDHNHNKIIQNSKGEYLALKDWKNITGRGTLQQGGKPKNAGLDAAHVIADQFTGTGYELFKGKQKLNANVIYTSAKFNQETMVTAENEIEDFIIQNKRQEEIRRGGKDIDMFFNLNVNINWEELNPDVDDKIIADIKADIDGGRTKHYEDLKGKTLAEIKAEVLATFTKYGLPEKLQRVKGIAYNITLKDGVGFSRSPNGPVEIEEDKWLGLVPSYQKKSK